MFVGISLPMEIQPPKTDVLLEYSYHWCFKAFADRLPIVHLDLREKIARDGNDSGITLLGSDGPLVHKYRSDPPGFMMSPAFSGVKELIRELDLPTNPYDVFFSKVWTVEEFADLNKKYPEYDKYSIETFGIRVTLVPEDYPVHLIPRVPNRFNPFNLPRYWLTPSLELIQIWRIRVFNCSIQRLNQSVNYPVTRRDRIILFLEECWHPSYWDTTFVGGLAGKDASWSQTLESFFRTARHILSATPHRGRKQGSGLYPKGAKFYAIVREVYFEMKDRLGRPPQQKEVIPALCLSRSAFRYYWRSTERSWPPIHPYSIEVF